MVQEQLAMWGAYEFSPYERPKADLTKLPRRSSRREAVLRLVIKAKRRGITEEEMSRKLVLTSNQLRKARMELLDGGFIEDLGMRRPTAFGDMAIVWRASVYGQEKWERSGRK